ncbi:hypothetical protein KSC_033000 [Ktedonobacter sp. SOSP1-52]|uniref:class I SAM-dependent methyltransferase n=1 Tax=Ktedonobacter sp. SOSP1-52 TaxID=2778366 RepID=UPI0019164FED|nr:class I SAM-dependent methyltransferase [Ktedonobacter sp. SOSP1-52]GHO64408.1 hypothetical protein KSC_033000 [Ktedonobacter sp. SOSP1-52]
MNFLSRIFGKQSQQQKEDTIFSSSPLEALGERQVLTDAPYVLPKDTQEISRLDFQHFLLRQAFQSNYLSPITQPKDILDVGAGTGRWADELAQAFPQAFVIGCDLVEQTTEKSFKQPNYRFVEADVLKGLPFRDRSFDFVHQRLLFLAIPAHAWPSELLELVRVARPGGWIELVESEIQARNAGPATQRMGQWIIEVSKRRGIDSSQVPHLGTYLKNAGLQNVVTRSVTVPMGQWGGRVGSMMAANINSAYQAMKPLITSQLGISPEAYEKNILLQHQEWEELHPASVFYAAYGQRPH